MHLKLLLSLLLFSTLASAKTWLIDPNGTYKSPNDVKNLIDHGDTIQIESASYKNQPQVYFTKNNLLIHGINGLPTIEGGSTLASNANGKALFVISGQNCRVENIAFVNAKVPDGNGAGIRQEGCGLVINSCIFRNNEMGILGGNYSNCVVTIERCIFSGNGNTSEPGFRHNVYINHIDTLIFRYNYSYDAIAQGHELKSRARNNIILYNYIQNKNTIDSRNIDLPNGGTAIVMGNIIEQGEKSANTNLIAFGMEGLSNPGPHNFWVVNNTFVNYKTKGSFVQVRDGVDTLFLQNNIMVGAKTGGLILGSAKHLDSAANFVSDDVSSPQFVNSSTSNFRLQSNSPCIDQGNAVTISRGVISLTPSRQYVLPNLDEARKIENKIDIGAYEYNRPLAIQNASMETGIKLTNPITDNRLVIHNLPGITSYTIYSLSGIKIMDGQMINGVSRIDDLKPGLYMLQTGAYKTRFVKY